MYSKANYTKIISAWFSPRFFITIVPWLLNLLVFFVIKEQHFRFKFNNFAEYFSIYAQETTTRDYFHFILLQSLYLCSRSLVRILKLLTFFKPPINHCQPNFNPKNSTWIIFDTSEAFLKKSQGCGVDNQNFPLRRQLQFLFLFITATQFNPIYDRLLMYSLYVRLRTDTNLSSIKGKIYHRDDDIDVQRIRRVFTEFDTLNSLL